MNSGVEYYFIHPTLDFIEPFFFSISCAYVELWTMLIEKAIVKSNKTIEFFYYSGYQNMKYTYVLFS